MALNDDMAWGLHGLLQAFLWDVRAGKSPRTCLQGSCAITSLQMANDGCTLLAGTEAGTVHTHLLQHSKTACSARFM